jgi:NitT/TauT family transport system permease protein
MTENKKLGRAMPYLTVFAMLIVWELTCILLAVPSFVLPRPSIVAISLYQNFGTIWFHAERTLLTTLLGFGVAVVVGVILGILVGSSRLIYQGLYPVLIGFNSVPKVALVPLMVVWFGIGYVPAVLTAFMLSFFPIAVNIATGIATLEPELQDVLRSLGASRLDVIRRVGLPRSLPYFFASLKIAITLAFVGSVISETLASDRGIGALVEQASANFKIPLVFAGLVVVATLGIAMYAIFAYMEKRMTHWATRTIEFGIGG